jgi:hypothetical protein
MANFVCSTYQKSEHRFVAFAAQGAKKNLNLGRRVDLGGLCRLFGSWLPNRQGELAGLVKPTPHPNYFRKIFHQGLHRIRGREPS